MKSRFKTIDFDQQYFLADLDLHKLYLVEELTCKVFELIESHTEEQIVLALSEKYPENDVYNSIQQVKAILSTSVEKPLYECKPKIFAPTPSTSQKRMKAQFLGASVAQREILKALTKYAQVHVTQEYDGIDDLVVIPFDPKSLSSVSFVISESYDGILLAFLDDADMISLLTYLHTPVVLPAYVIRGDNARITNSMLSWHSFMRAFDAFMVPNQETADFFSTIIQDTSIFHVIPFGVDTDFFHPVDKKESKREISNLLNMPEINQKKIVGYISRFEVEKGAGILVDIARLMPDVMFVAVGMTEDPRNYSFPSNLITVSPQQREKTRTFYNAFDVFCFPSVASTETFGLVVLEAMACGTVPIVLSYDGPKYIVEGAGIIVDAITFDRDMASLGGTSSAYNFAKAISELLQDEQKREQMGERARQRALEFTWDNTAKELLKLFKMLNLKKRLIKYSNYFPIGFSLSLTAGGSASPKAVIINAIQDNKAPLTGKLYDTSIEEGIALLFSSTHSPHEIEVVLSYLLQDHTSVANCIDRTKGFLRSLF